jgi:hypothetical protein
MCVGMYIVHKYVYGDVRMCVGVYVCLCECIYIYWLGVPLARSVNCV